MLAVSGREVQDPKVARCDDRVSISVRRDADLCFDSIDIGQRGKAGRIQAALASGRVEKVDHRAEKGNGDDKGDDR